MAYPGEACYSTPVRTASDSRNKFTCIVSGSPRNLYSSTPCRYLSEAIVPVHGPAIVEVQIRADLNISTSINYQADRSVVLAYIACHQSAYGSSPRHTVI